MYAYNVMPTTAAEIFTKAVIKIKFLTSSNNIFDHLRKSVL